MNFRDKKLSFGIVYVGIIVLFSLLGLYFNLAKFTYSLFDSDSISIIFYLSLILGLTTILDFISSKNLNSYKVKDGVENSYQIPIERSKEILLNEKK